MKGLSRREAVEIRARHIRVGDWIGGRNTIRVTLTATRATAHHLVLGGGLPDERTFGLNDLVVVSRRRDKKGGRK